MFDNYSADLLSGNDFAHSTLTDTSPFGQTTGFHNQIGDSMHHFDANHQFTGSSQHFGNTVQHHDALGMSTGSSQMIGNDLYHYDSHHQVTGHDVQQGGNTMHYNASNQLIGRTDAFGNQFDSMGRMLGASHKF